jgi:hypothetical protein
MLNHAESSSSATSLRSAAHVMVVTQLLLINKTA